MTNLFTTETQTESADEYKNSPGSINSHPIDAAQSTAELLLLVMLLAAADDGGPTVFKVA